VPEHGAASEVKWRLVRIDDSPCCSTHLVLPPLYQFTIPSYTRSASFHPKYHQPKVTSKQPTSSQSTLVSLSQKAVPTRFVSQFPLYGRRLPGWLNMICWTVTNLLRTAAIEYAHQLYDITQKEETRSLVKVIFESLFPYINTSTLLITPSSRHHRHSLL